MVRIRVVWWNGGLPLTINLMSFALMNQVQFSVLFEQGVPLLFLIKLTVCHAKLKVHGPCFTDNAAHLDDMTQRPSESTLSPSGSTLLHLSVSSTPSQSSFIPNVDSGAEKALIVGSDQGFTASMRT